MNGAKGWNEKQKETDSYKKLWHYFVSLQGDAAFLKVVTGLRKLYHLPSTGVPLEEDIFETYFSDAIDWMDFQTEVHSLAKKFGLPWNWMRQSLRDYIIYNEIIEPSSGEITGVNLVNLPHLFKQHEAWSRTLAQDFPVAICIHPYASEREILDFVRKTYKSRIEPGLKKYRSPEVKLGKIRKKNQRVKERNEFICKNKDLEIGQIWSLVQKEFGDDLDFGTIYKIRKEC